MGETNQATIRKLRGYERLPVGWHYGSGGPIPAPTIDLAVKIEGMLRESGFNETDCFPGCDGEVQVCGYRIREGICMTVEIRSETYEPRPIADMNLSSDTNSGQGA